MHDIEQLIIWGGFDPGRITSPIGHWRQAGIIPSSASIALHHFYLSFEKGGNKLSFRFRYSEFEVMCVGRGTFLIPYAVGSRNIPVMVLFESIVAECLINFLAFIHVFQRSIALFGKTLVRFGSLLWNEK
jgi:hypothetical protein